MKELEKRGNEIQTWEDEQGRLGRDRVEIRVRVRVLREIAMAKSSRHGERPGRERRDRKVKMEGNWGA